MPDLMETLTALHEYMQSIGENRMGDLTRAEAALFHNATTLIGDLVDSLTERCFIP